MKQIILAAVLGAALPGMAAATDYPVTVTDIAGRTVEIKAEPQRIVVQDGRDLFALALLDRADPMARIVAWNNIVSRSDPRTWELFAKQWPESAARAVDMKFGDEGQVNIEQVVAAKPDLAIFQVRVKQAAEKPAPSPSSGDGRAGAPRRQRTRPGSQCGEDGRPARHCPEPRDRGQGIH